MSDDLVKRLREGDAFERTMSAQRAADRIEELEAKLEMAEESLTVIDALDPEGFVNGCSPSALIGLVSRMGAIARTTLAELKGQGDE